MRLRGMTGRLAAALAVALVLAGCAGRPELSADRARALEQGVLTVTTAAAAGNWDGADSGIAALHAQLDAAKRSGEVSSTRYGEIVRALDRVSADVSAERTKAAEAQAAAERAAAEQAAAAQAAADLAAQQQASAPAGTGAKPHPDQGNDSHGKKGK